MIIPIKGQAVKLLPFNAADFNMRNKGCGQATEDLCQPVAKGMIQQFQVLLGKKTGTQILLNPEFANNITNWNPGGVAVHSANYGGSMLLTGNGTATQTVAVNANSYYYVEAKVRGFQEFLSTANSSIVLNANVTFEGDNTLGKLAGQQSLVKDKILQIWITTGASTSATIGLQAGNAIGNIEYCRMYELTIPTAEVRTCDDEVEFDADVDLFKDVAIITIDWNELSADEGCFKVCVFPDGNTAINLLNCQEALTDHTGRELTDQTECITSNG